MPLSAQSLVLDLLSAVGGKPIPVRTLVGVAGLFGITENNLRVAVARLVSSDKIERNERGSYGLSAAARPVQEHVASWTQAAQRMRRWRGSWIGVHTAGVHTTGANKRSGVRRGKRALTLLGLRELEQGLWLRPDNLEGGVTLARARLQELGLDERAAVYGISELDDATDQRARDLWDARAIELGYVATRDELTASAKRLDSLSQERAMVEYFVVGGRAIKQAAYDPLLPEPIVSATARHELIEALRQYDRAGRGCWQDFMRGHDAPSLALSSFRILERVA